MWKKLQQNYGRASLAGPPPSTRVIGHPVLLDTTMDEKTLESYKNAHEVLLERTTPSPPSSSLPGRPAHYFPDVLDEEEAEVKELRRRRPSAAHQSHHISSRDRPISEVPTRSSMYSQPSPDLSNLQRPNARAGMATSAPYDDGDISPPSSPETSYATRDNQHGWQESPDISPVDDRPGTHSFAQQLPPSSHFTSNIPLPLRNLRNASASAPAPFAQASSFAKPTSIEQGWYAQPLAEDRKRDTQWGDFVGQQRRPTALRSTDTNRKLPQRKPLDSNAKLNFAQRAKGLGVDTSGIARPEWKGYSGRQANVGQIRDDLEKASSRSPIATTPRSIVPIQRLSAAGSGNSGSSTPISVLHRPQQPETSQVSTHTPSPPLSNQHHDELWVKKRRGGAEDDDIKPIVPLKAGRNTPPKQPSPPGSATTMPTSALTHYSNDPRVPPPLASPSPIFHSSPFQPSPRTPIFDPSGYDEVRQREAYSLLTGGHDPSAPHVPRELPEVLRRMIPEDQPPSRFSFTTYGTSNADDATTTTSSSIPASPADFSHDNEASNPPSPILSRKRPIPSKTLPSPAPLRIDTTPYGLGVLSLHDSPKPIIALPLNDAAWRDSKALPQLPAEIARSEDQIANLEAEIENLKSQRWNLGVVVTSYERTPGVSKERLKAKKDELDDVNRDIHELGMKLSRAWRRRDKAECREEGVLWVRRVTG